MLLAVPVQFVLGFGGEVGKVDFQCGVGDIIAVVVVEPYAGSLVALVVNVNVGWVPGSCQPCFGVRTGADGLPEFYITSFSPIADPSVLLAIFPSRADNSKANPIAFVLVVANLLQIDVNRLLALMTLVHSHGHIHI